jgi:hypothetical protein
LTPEQWAKQREHEERGIVWFTEGLVVLTLTALLLVLVKFTFWLFQ